LEVRVPAGARNFSLHHRVHTGSEAHPASYPPGTRGSFPGGVKRPGREPDHSPPSRVEVKNARNYHSPNTPSWRGAELKHRDSFTYYILSLIIIIIIITTTIIITIITTTTTTGFIHLQKWGWYSANQETAFEVEPEFSSVTKKTFHWALA
jgi:hypothetical protein